MAKTTALRAFHGDPAIKANYLARLEEHCRKEQFIQSSFITGSLEDDTFCGTAVGCTIHSNEQILYESELGITQSLAWLEDRIFDDFPAAEAPQFAIDFLEAIPVGADLSLVVPRFLHWLLVDEVEGIIYLPIIEKVRTATRGVGRLLARYIAGKKITLRQWQATIKTVHRSVVVRHSKEKPRGFCGTFDPNPFPDAPASEAVANAASEAALACCYEACGEPDYAYNTIDTVVTWASFHRSWHVEQAAKLLQLLREAPIAKSPEQNLLTRTVARLFGRRAPMVFP